jgi:ATP-binding cassette subfamily B protein
MSAPRPYSNAEIYRRLFREAQPCWRHIAGLFLISLLSAPLALATPIPLKLVVDCVLGTHPLPSVLRRHLPNALPRADLLELGAIAGLCIILAVLKQMADLSFALLRTYTGEKVVLAFRAKLFRHTQGLSLSYHDSRGTADSTYRIQYDAPAIQWILVDALIPLASAAITLGAMAFIMVRLDWQLALVALTVAPLLVLVSLKYSRWLKLRWREAKDLESATLGVVQEVLSSVRVVKAFAQEDREQRRYLEQAGKNLREQLRLALTGGMFSFLVGLLMAAGSAAVLFMGARHVQAGHLTLGEFILLMSYLTLLYTPLQTLSRSAASLQGSMVSMERALALLDQAADVVEKPNPLPLRRTRGQVTFRNVGFSYQPSRPALRHISFEISAGDRVGITGATGAGKSTLVSMLLRLYDPTTGEILLDGVDLREYRLVDLRNQFAIVLQEPVLFSTTIAENIAYARPTASEKEVIAAADAASAHDFIRRLPRGYQTQVGERGLQLSGGERQRISLARAFLKNAPILILDEPTSSIDVQTEGLILEAMARLMADRTSFMIAHRLSTLEICNVRLHLEHGSLVPKERTRSAEEATLSFIN